MAAASADVLDRHISLDENELLQEIAQFFGILRVGGAERDSLQEGVELLVRGGGAARRDGALQRAALSEGTKP